MAKFRKGLPTVENHSSDSEYEEYFDPPNDEDRRKRKRQIKPPKKLSEYETEGSMGNAEDELCWCIIEWEGENSYDCVNRKKVSAVEGDLMFQPGEKIFANYRGKPFKATIAVIAATKGDAESAYKENKQPKQSIKPHKRSRQAESAAKPLEKEKQRKKAEKGKQATEKKKSQAQEDRELKASIQKAQREQMKEVLKETNELNYELISDDISEDDDVPVTPFHSSPKITMPKAAIPRNTDQSCCQQCGVNKDAILRNSQALQILQQGISALKNEIEGLRRKESSQSPSITSTPISSKNSTSSTPRPCPALQCSINSSPERSDTSITDKPNEKELTTIPHHLKSKAAGANALKKAARILAVGLFTVEERCSCTVSGSSNKSKEDNKRPQFDIYRMPLIHEFLQKTYPKTYQHGEVNRIIGQVAIESRQGRHATDDSIVVSMLQGAKYVVLTSKHHEGWTNWKSNVSWNWNSVDNGPHRDLVGDLASSIRTRTNITFGLYYSLYEWFHPLYLKDRENKFTTQLYVDEVMLPQLYDIVNAYKPSYVWSDGDWDASDTYWNSTEFLAWLYNDSPVKDTVVVNDRWGAGDRCHHGGVYTCGDRYNPGVLQKHKWENCMTVDKQSWGYRRNTTIADFQTMDELTSILASTVSCGGNLLMNVGPTADGRIDPIFQERLQQMGDWLKVNGEGIYGTKPWRAQNDTETPNIWYTSKAGLTYAIVLDWPKTDTLTLGAPIPTEATVITLLGLPDVKFSWKPMSEGKGVIITIPPLPASDLPCQWAWVFRMTSVQ